MLDIPSALLHHFPLKGHLRSHYDVIGSPYVLFLPITFDRNKLGTWSWCHSVCLVKAHRLTCDMIYLGHTVNLTWRDLRSNFKIDLSRIKKHLDRSDLTRGARWCQNYSFSLSSWEEIHEKHFHQNTCFFLWWPLVLTVLGWPPIWGHRSIAEIQGYHLAILQSCWLV